MPIIKKLVNKYRKEGFRGLKKAIFRRLFNPVQIAIDEICKGNDFSIVQIGAYVGNTSNDPLFQTLSNRLQKAGGRLICVEPVKVYFERLVENYGSVPNVFFENVAISDHSGRAPFYRLAVDPVDHGFPEWLSQLGSLKEERMGSLWDRYEADKQIKDFYIQHRTEESVDCITFAELLRRHNLSTIDLLQIDVEGYELEILRTIDFGQVFIRFVNYESTLLCDHKKEAERLMRESGYRLVDHDHDTFCYRGNDSQKLLWSWIEGGLRTILCEMGLRIPPVLDRLDTTRNRPSL
jgi:FkbM family methyltransferase